jgi:polar amino acid transport system substrate-binding protein
VKPESDGRVVTTRIAFLSLGLVLATALIGCANTAARPTPQVRHILAPSGPLRVAIYTGTPTSVLSATDLRGVGYELGKELARRLGVPFEPMIFTKNSEVLEAVKTGRADAAFTNASAERAKDMDFTSPYLLIELGYLASAKTSVAVLADVDQAGVRVGVTASSSTDATLSHDLKQAQVVRAETVAAGTEMLAASTIDVYATNKPTLFDMADRLPGSKVLEGSWGVERHALAIPKGRDLGMAYARAFVAEAVRTGLVKAAADRAKLRGAVVAGHVS